MAYIGELIAKWKGHSMIQFNNTYGKLPNSFYKEAVPNDFPHGRLIVFNEVLAHDLGWDVGQQKREAFEKVFTGQQIPKGAEPIALAYAGHQFGNFVPQLGDGRALLLGEVLTPEKKRYDLQLKGSGRTFFSRNGDGKSALGPVIREYILSEAMHSLGVPTTRALAAATTGETVLRETELPGGIFTRVASSHIRIGTFEYFAAKGDIKSIQLLTDYALDRHYPELQNSSEKVLAFLREVAKRQANLVAKWMSIGFIHGVMNTDNMSISGETIDYGPCAFMDNFHFNRVFSSIDRQGRYSYSNQLNIAKWNLTRLAECLVPLVHENQEQAIQLLQKALDELYPLYHESWLAAMMPKFGLQKGDPKDDEDLINSFLNYLQSEDLDFTLSFKELENTLFAKGSLEGRSESFLGFYKHWQDRLKKQRESLEFSSEIMSQANPYFIPRNHQVEKAIQLSLKGDYSHFHKMNKVLLHPYQEQPDDKDFLIPPKPSERVRYTFCGT